MTGLPRVLISNDDGILAPGIQALVGAMEPVAEVWVVAPDRERSAVSHSISLHTPLRVRQVDERRFAVDGTPTDSVYLGVNHFMPEPPDLVFSGINLGANLGNDVLYSGTVSAAMEGALFGFKAVAISLCMPDDHRERQVLHFETAGHVALQFLRALSDSVLPAGVVMNLNIPNRPIEALAGLKLCRLGFTDWADSVTRRTDPRGLPYYWIGGARTGHDAIADSDNNAVAAGFVSVTPIHYDLTDYRSFSATRNLRLPDMTWAADSLGDEPLPHPVHPRIR